MRTLLTSTILIPILLIACNDSPTDPAGPAAVTVVAGADATGVVATELSAPLRVKVTDASGNAVPDVEVSWSVTAGGGSMAPATSTTNDEGLAEARWTLGSTAGAQTATAAVSGVPPVTFTATAEAAAPASLEIVSGAVASAAAGATLPDPLVVRVSDAFGDVAEGVKVVFSASHGGTFDPAETQTNAEGVAESVWTLGSTEGTQTATIEVGELNVDAALEVVAPEPVGTVDESGGTLSDESGTVELAFPAGAVPAAVEITAIPSTDYIADPDLAPGTAFEFGPDGTQFEEPVTLSIEYDPAALPADVPESSLRLYKAYEDGWRQIEGSTVDTEAHTVSGQITSFSTYGILSVGGAAAVSPHAGDGQTAVAGTAVATPPAVVVRNDQGDPVPDIDVVFEIASGGGAITADTATTDARTVAPDANGIATPGDWTLGTAEGENTLTATVAGLDPVTFTATAVDACDFAPALAVGDSIGGALGALDCVDENGRYNDYYTLELAEPANLTFHIGTAAFTPRVGASDADGNYVVAQPSATPGSTRAVLGAGSYRLYVSTTDDDAGTGGAYALSVRTGAADPNVCGEFAFATVGGHADGDMSTGDCIDEFTGIGDRVDTDYIKMLEGETYRMTFTVDGNTGVSIWGNDGSGWALKEHRRIPHAGTHTITYTATHFGYHVVNPLAQPGIHYEIEFEKVEAVSCAPADAYYFGTFLTGQFTDGDCEAEALPEDFYRIDVSEQTSVRIEMTAGNVTAGEGAPTFTPFVRIVRPDRQTVTTGFTSLPGVTRTVLAPGTYWLRASSSTEGARGTYTVGTYLESHDLDGCGAAYTVFVTPGVTTSGTVTANDCLTTIEPESGRRYDTYYIRTAAGRTYTATMTADQWTILSVWAPDETGTWVEKNYVNGEGAPLELSYTADADGWAFFNPVGLPGVQYDISFSVSGEPGTNP